MRSMHYIGSATIRAIFVLLYHTTLTIDREPLPALFSTARLCHSEMVALYNGFSGCSNTASALYNAVPDLPSYHLNNEKNIHWWTSCDQVLDLTAKSQTSVYIQSQQQTQSLILKSPYLMSAKQLSRLCMYCLPLDAHAKIPQSHCTMPFPPAAILRMHCTLLSMIAKPAQYWSTVFIDNIPTVTISKRAHNT